MRFTDLFVRRPVLAVVVNLVILIAVIYLPTKVGGWEHIFDAAKTKMATPKADGKPTGAFVPGPTTTWAYATLGLGSALAAERLRTVRELGYTEGWRMVAPDNIASLRTLRRTGLL